MTIFDLISLEINSNIKELTREEYSELMYNKKIKYMTPFIEGLMMYKICTKENLIDMKGEFDIKCFLYLDIKYFTVGVYKYLGKYVLI